MLDKMAELLSSECNWVSLHSARPDPSSASATELSFGGYTRQQVFWKVRSSGVLISTNPIVFTGLRPPVTIAAIGLSRTDSVGTLTAYGMLPYPVISGSTSYRLDDEMLLRIA